MKHFRLFLICIFSLFGISCFGQMLAPGNERPIALNTKSGTLNGKLSLPAKGGNIPVVLLISGSGPTDMDGNSAIGQMKNNSLKYLADNLAKQNIASLRFDKRGIASSASAGKDEYSVRLEDFVEDVKGWIDLLARDKRFSGILIAGHSEGSLIGMLASQNNPKVKAFISLAGPGRPLYELLEEQVSSQPEVIRNMVVSINDSLKRGKLVPNVPLGLQALFRPSVQPFLISCYKYNPSEIVKTLKVPVLIIQGKTDIQVSVKDAELLKQSAPSAEICLIDRMNHVLKECDTTEPNRQLVIYADPSLPLSSALVPCLTSFIKKHLR